MKKLILSAFFYCAFTSANSQPIINQEWEIQNGHPLGLEWTQTIINPYDQLIRVGNISSTNGQGADIWLVKYNSNGSIIWQNSFHTSSTNNDYGIALTEDANGNIYVVGATDNATTGNHDVVVLKYSANGNLFWSQTYGTPHNSDDYATDVIVDANGNVYVSVSSMGSTTLNDYLLLKYDANGNLQWDARYDYASLEDVPIGIDFDNADNIFITGGSASSSTNWDYTIATYDPSGNFLSATRTAILGLGFDQPTDFTIKGGNIYVTGRSSVNGIDYDMMTLRFDAQYNLMWNVKFDMANLEDVGKDIEVDNSGNVYVGGFATNENGDKEYNVIKYDALGNQIWDYHQTAFGNTGNAEIVSLKVSVNEEVYFLGKEDNGNGSVDMRLTKLSPNGYLEWAEIMDSPVDEEGNDINLGTDGSVYISALLAGINNEYTTLKYSEYKQSDSIILDSNGDAAYMAHQLIVKFRPSALNLAAIDNNIGTAEIYYEGIDYWLTPTALAQFNQALEGVCVNGGETQNSNPCGVIGVRIFRELRTHHTTTTSRMGETIPVPKFWSALLLDFPHGTDIYQVHLALKNITNIVDYSHPNWAPHLTAVANDDWYSLQESLYSNASNRKDAHINVEPAWDYEVGKSFVKCGVFDTGIEWVHDDFGYVQNVLDGKVNGWDFLENKDVKNASLPSSFSPLKDEDHGTKVAGILGAIRNDIKTNPLTPSNGNNGIAGIAGGDEINGLGSGISLYSMKITNGSFFSNNFQYIYDAIATSAMDDPTMDYAYGLHLGNHSWGLRTNAVPPYSAANVELIRDAMRFITRAGVVSVASNGNFGSHGNVRHYPASIDDDWVINVGGTGNNGEYNTALVMNHTPNYGYDIDIAAPFVPTLVYTTDVGKSIATNTHNNHTPFEGTSASAPHVAGVVGLLLSNHNSPTPDYQNLSLEDCEQLIQLSATDKTILPPTVPGTGIGYDDYTGWGLLNAGDALDLLHSPDAYLEHYGSKSPDNTTISVNVSYIQVATNTVVNLSENYENIAGTNFQAGSYIVNKYKVDATAQHILLSNLGQIRAYWPRPSSSDLLEDVQNNGDLLPRERVIINSCNATNCDMTAYAYEVFDMNNQFMGWWPFDITQNTQNIAFEYTILTYDPNNPGGGTNTSSIEEIKKEGIKISLYPNPSNTSNTLSIYAKKSGKIKISLFDIQGKKISDIYNGIYQEGKNEYTNDKLTELSKGMYFYGIDMNGKKEFIKFIKD